MDTSSITSPSSFASSPSPLPVEPTRDQARSAVAAGSGGHGGPGGRGGNPGGVAANAATPRNASASDWIAVAAGALGALLATLDISITNSALPQIQGQIGASGT